MAPSPDYAANLTKTLVELFGDAEIQILRLIAKRIAKGLDAPDWQLRQLNEAHRLRAELQNLTAALRDGSQDRIARAIDAAYSYGVARAGSELKAAGAVDAIAFGGVNLDALTNLVDQAKKALGSTLLPIQSSAERIYADVVQQTASRMLAGVGTRRQAAGLALKDWARRGVTGFTDRAGRNWSIVDYAAMVSRTTAQQALDAGHTDRMLETGHDLVLVTASPEPCKACAPWQGKILSLTGATAPGRYSRRGQSYTVAGTLDDAITAGYKHPQCTHRQVGYLPGFTRPLDLTDSHPETYVDKQRQRAWERRIRKHRAEVEVLKDIDPAAATEARRRLAKANAEFTGWLDETGRKRVPGRTSLKVR